MKDFIERAEKATKLYVENYNRVTELTLKQPEQKPTPQPEAAPTQKPDYSPEHLYELCNKGGSEWETKLDQLVSDAEIY
jgi:hypothetical protein